MKKFMSVLLAAVLAFSMSAAVFAARNGDMDGDNIITAGDARSILRAAVGLDTPDEALAQLADLDMDGNITAGDARTALRAAVGLDVIGDAVCYNDYDVLRSGRYLAEFTIPEEGMTEPMVLAIGDGASYMRVSMADDSFAEFGITSLTLPLLFTEQEVYLLDEKNKQYGPFPFEEFGMSADELTDLSGADLFSALKPLSEADEMVEGSFNGKPCTVYTFRYANGSVKAFMNGKKLAAICYYNVAGEIDTSYIFNLISIAVPAEYISIPSGYTEAEDPLVMIILMLFGDLFTEDD